MDRREELLGGADVTTVGSTLHVGGGVVVAEELELAGDQQIRPSLA